MTRLPFQHTYVNARLSTSSGARLDDVDLEMLRRLHAAARIPNQDLAKQLRLSPSACLQRMRRLENAGVITRYVAEVDENVLSVWSILWVEVELCRKAMSMRRAFEEAVRAMPYIIEAHELAGGSDYLLKVSLPTLAAWPDLRANLDPDNSIMRKVRILGGVRTAKPRAAHPLLSAVVADPALSHASNEESS